jgi:hypothetical protein
VCNSVHCALSRVHNHAFSILGALSSMLRCPECLILGALSVAPYLGNIVHCILSCTSSVLQHGRTVLVLCPVWSVQDIFSWPGWSVHNVLSRVVCPRRTDIFWENCPRRFVQGALGVFCLSSVMSRVIKGALSRMVCLEWYVQYILGKQDEMTKSEPAYGTLYRMHCRGCFLVCSFSPLVPIQEYF